VTQAIQALKVMVSEDWVDAKLDLKTPPKGEIIHPNRSDKLLSWLPVRARQQQANPPVAGARSAGIDTRNDDLGDITSRAASATSSGGGTSRKPHQALQEPLEP